MARTGSVGKDTSAGRFGRAAAGLAWALCMGTVGTLGTIAACGDAPLAPRADAAGTDAALPGFGGPFEAGATAADALAADAVAPDAQTADSAVADGAPGPRSTPDAVAADVTGAPNGDAGPLPTPDGAATPDAAGFFLAAHTPTLGQASVAAPLVITLTFNQPLKAASVGKTTVLVLGPADVELAGQFSVTGATATFVAAGPIPPASRIRVVVGPLVQSYSGVGLGEADVFHFYTAGYAGMAPYARLAARYAPTLRQGTSAGAAGALDRLRAVDFDGNWSADDNGAQAATPAALGVVGWSVVETRSHWFIGYVFYWPARPSGAAQPAFHNDTAGALVVVDRAPAEVPVALVTWFKAKATEEQWTWVTTESGLLPPGKKPEAYYLRAVLPGAELFPPAPAGDTWGCDGIGACQPRRYPGFLTAVSHQSCLWLDAGNSGLLQVPQCVATAQAKADLTWIDYLPAAAATAAPLTGASPGPSVAYGLQSLHDDWAPHRDETGPGTLFDEVLFAWQPAPGRPGAGLPKLASILRNPQKTDDFGRPPWAWGWQAASWYKMPRGALWLDPAWALWIRLSGEANPGLAWDPAKHAGMSLDLCFHPWLGVDVRASAACQPGPP